MKIRRAARPVPVRFRPPAPNTQRRGHMKERFEGQNEQHLIDALKRQEFADGNLDIATALKQSGELVEFEE